MERRRKRIRERKCFVIKFRVLKEKSGRSDSGNSSVGRLVGVEKGDFWEDVQRFIPVCGEQRIKKRFPHPRQGELFPLPPSFGRQRKKSFPFLNWMKIQLNFFLFLLRIFRERAIPLAHDVPSLFSFFFLTGK